MLTTLVTLVIYLLVICIVAGLLVWLVRSAPFVPEAFKPVITWIIYAIAVIAVCYVLLGLVDGGSVRLGLRN